MPSKAEFLTYDEWKARGFQVIRGEKSYYRGNDGKARFSPTQVKESRRRGSSGCDYEDHGYANQDYEYEGSWEQMLGSWDWYK